MSSEPTKQSISDRILIIIGGEAPFSWAAKIGIPKGTFHTFIHKNSDLKGRYLKRIIEKTGVSALWLMMGEGPMYKTDRQGAAADPSQEIAREAHPAGSYSAGSEQPDQANIQNLLRDLMDIMDSNDEGTKLAIAQNIKMFKESVRRKQQLDNTAVEPGFKTRNRKE